MPDGSPLFAQSLRQPPANLQAEAALLGALMANNRAFERVAEFLRAEHFADPLHGAVFAEIARRVAAGMVADGVTLHAHFNGATQFEDVGGAAPFLAGLLASMVGILNVPEYGRLIRDLWLRRQAIHAAERLMVAAYDPSSADGATAEGLIAEASSGLLALAEQQGGTPSVSLGQAAAAAVARSERALKGEADGCRLDTGLPSVDAIWGGLWPGQLYFLMARSRTGKTPFMLQVARHAASQIRDGVVHIFSLEMTAEDLGRVNLASTSRWSAQEIMDGRIGPATASKQWLELEARAQALAKLPILIDDQPDMDLQALMLRARAVRRKHNTRLICIDYRELIRRPRDQARMQLPEWVPFLGYQLKALAKAAGVPVIALAQINKSRDSADSTRPTLSDLPYDGGQAADGVFALWRPELEMPDDPPANLGGSKSEEARTKAKDEWFKRRREVEGMVEVIALKRRFGAPGSRKLRWDGPRMLVREQGDMAPAAQGGIWEDEG